MRSVIPVVFAGLATWFVVDPLEGPPAPVTTPTVDAALLAPTPERVPNGEPRIDVGGVPLSCNECHKLFESRTVTQRQLNQHKDIVLVHGQNARCLNCHANEDRNKYVMHDGTLVDFEDSPTLCSKCHGPTFRDWQEGIHGRSTGGWDTADSGRARLRCTECHDPHAPAFPGVEPMPGPNTWRMGQPHKDGHAPPSVLQRWLPAHHPDDDAHAASGEHADG